MNNRALSITTLLVCAAATLSFSSSCTEPRPSGSGQTPSTAEPEPLRATRWTNTGELFVEYPALVANETVRFAIHLTRLSDFQAVKAAACEVRLVIKSTPAAVFPCDPSTHPGIFGANVQPTAPGEAVMTIAVKGKDLTETFEVGPVKIAADAKSAAIPEEATEETINFTKEQQWSLDFATEVTREQTLRDNMRVAAETLPRTGGEAAVIAPIAGRLIVERTFPIGTLISKGAELSSILPPPTPAASDLTTLQLSESEAKLALEQAQRDRQRAERLFTAGAVPARRAEEARAVEATAQARLQASQTRLAQYDATRAADGAETGAKRFLVRAPITGIVSEAKAVSGSNVEIGTTLFRILDTDTLYVSGVVPESDYARLKQLAGAELEAADGTQIRTPTRLVTIGRLVDSATRTVPVVYEIDNRDHSLAVNQTVFLRLLLTTAGKSPVVPEAAIVDDGGRPIVFVQRAGEKFLRRPVTLGIRNNGMVQILDGVSPGDRVVTKGAYLIRLASMSSQVPAHGHVH